MSSPPSAGSTTAGDTALCAGTTASASGCAAAWVPLAASRASSSVHWAALEVDGPKGDHQAPARALLPEIVIMAGLSPPRETVQPPLRQKGPLRWQGS